MEKILITYATRPLGLRVAKLLEQKMQVEKASSDEIPSVLRSIYTNLPQAESPVYAHELLKLALDKNCNYLLPLGIIEIQALSESIVLFEEYGITVLCPPRALLEHINVLSKPAGSVPLHLIHKGKDILNGEGFEFAVWDGLCLVSDSEDDFILAVV